MVVVAHAEMVLAVQNGASLCVYGPIGAEKLASAAQSLVLPDVDDSAFQSIGVDLVADFGAEVLEGSCGGSAGREPLAAR